jgi:hypothetical protein
MDQQKFQDQNQFKKIINNQNQNLNQELMLIIPLISLLVLL